MKKNFSYWLRLCSLILAGLIIITAAAYFIIALTIYADSHFRTWAIPVCFLIALMMGLSGGAFIMDRMNYASSIKLDAQLQLLKAMNTKKSSEFIELLKKHYKTERAYKEQLQSNQLMKQNCDATQLQLKTAQEKYDKLLEENYRLIAKLEKAA